jgi:hypothetical protein
VLGGNASLTIRQTTADGKFKSSGRSAISDYNWNYLKYIEFQVCYNNYLRREENNNIVSKY